MRRFRNVLAVIEHGKPLGNATDHAINLARRNGAGLTIMETFEQLPEDILLSLEGGSGRRIMKEFDERRRARLAESAPRWSGLDPTLLFPAGKPFHEIVRRVIDAEHDLFVKAAEPPPTASTRLFGSVDMHLIRKCPSAVWPHKPGGDGGIRSILACVDLDTEGERRRLPAISREPHRVPCKEGEGAFRVQARHRGRRLGGPAAGVAAGR